MTENRDQIAEKFKGVLVGAAIGDALGAPYEFGLAGKYDEDYVGECYDVGCFGTAPGAPTDDSTLVRLHGEALLAMESTKTWRYHYMRRASAWRDSGPPDIGGQTSRAIGCWNTSEKYPEDDERAAGNGSLMAVSPIALVAGSANDAAALGERFAEFTHPSGAAKFANRQYCAALWKLSRGEDIGEVQAQCSLPRPYGLAVDGGSQGFCLVSGALAFETLDRCDAMYWDDGSHVTPFQGLCHLIANEGGDTDTNACIAGAMLGAAYGYKAWTEKMGAPLWLTEKLEGHEKWLELADKLVTKYVP